MKQNQQFSDNELVSSIKTNSNLNIAIGFIYRQYFDSLSSLITYHSGSLEDAKDIVQEVIVNFIETVRSNKFRGESSIKTFLHAMTRNTWLNELKKRSRSDRRDKIFENGRASEENIEGDVIEKREATQQLLDVFATLGAGCKKILTLFYYEELSMKDILAQTTYDNEQVVRNKKHKCLKELTNLVRNNTSIIEILKES